MLEQTLLDEILQATDLQALAVSEGVVRQGGKFLCPFHDDHHPSLVINNNLFFCHACHAKGNAFHFLMNLRHLSFSDAVHHLASHAGVLLEKGQTPVFDAGLRLLGGYARYAARCLPDASVFLDQRRISQSLCERFFLGYATGNTQGLLSKIMPQDRQEAIRVGLLKETPQGDWVGFFRNRLLFPIRTIRGDVVGFAGRAVDNTTSPKYLNSPENPLFHKKKVLYGIYEGKEHIQSKGHVILVEGYMDVLRCHDSGVLTVAGLCGTSLSREHVRLLTGMGVKNVTLCLDGDKAGQQSTLRIVAENMDAPFRINVVWMPDGDDPDSFVLRHGKDAFCDILTHTVDGIDCLLNGFLREGQGYAQRVASIAKIVKAFSKIRDQELQNLAFRKLTELTPFSLDELIRMGHGHMPKHRAGVPTHPEMELLLLDILLAHPHLVVDVGGLLPPESLQNTECRILYRHLLDSGGVVDEELPEYRRLMDEIKKNKRPGSEESSEAFAKKIALHLKREWTLLDSLKKLDEDENPLRRVGEVKRRISMERNETLCRD